MPHLWKPVYVKHEGGITSVDVHPDRTRFATAGVDGKVMVWRVDPLVDASWDERDYEPLLAVLQNHTSAVNIVRWSPDGRFLASGGDDRAIIIWERREGVPTSIKLADNPTFVPTENWQPRAVMRDGHEGDVLDLCWSPDGLKIASASVDNKVAIWDVPTQRILTRLERHTAHVKGVAWDPLGRFLASSADDKTVRLWRTSDYVVDSEVKSPFRRAPTNVMYKRLCWSPDGQVLVASGATKNGKDIAAIISRKDWSTDKEFVGHNAPVSAVKFSPAFYFDDARKGVRMICALGGSDNTISIWMTDRPRALVAVTKMFGQIVTDLSWSADGAFLLASSLDGTLGVVRFDENEIGTRLSQQDANSYMASLYGDVYTNAIAASSYLIEDPNLLSIADSNSRRAPAASSSSSAAAAAPVLAPPRPATAADMNAMPTTHIIQNDGRSQLVSISTAGETVEQIITSTKSGKRRIQPLSVSNAPAAADIPAMPSFAPRVAPLPPSSPAAPSAAFPSSAPLFGGGSPFGGESSTFSAWGGGGGGGSSSVGKKRKRSEDDDGSAVATAAGPAAAADTEEQIGGVFESARNIPNRTRARRIDESEEESSDEAPNPVENNPLGHAARVVQRVVVAPPPLIRPPSAGVASSRFIREHKLTESEISTLSLALPENDNAAAGGGAAAAGAAAANARPEKIIMEITHTKEALIGHMSHVTCMIDSTVLWKDRLKNQLCVAAVSPRFHAVGSLAGDVQIYSPAGRRLLSGIMLGSAVCFLEFSEDSSQLVAICSDGQFFLWNLTLLVLIESGSVAPVLVSPSGGSPHTIASVNVVQSTVVIVTQPHGDSFAYNSFMKCWTRMQDHKSFTSSNFWATNKLTTAPGPLHNLVLEVANRSRLSLAAVAATTEQIRLMETLAHLESNMSAAAQLESKEEFKVWFKSYIRQLTELAATNRLEEVCADLLGPAHASGSTDTWDSQIVGLDKRQLLVQDVLPIMATNILLQRMASKYRESAALISQQQQQN